jgi:hypothetical protein
MKPPPGGWAARRRPPDLTPIEQSSSRVPKISAPVCFIERAGQDFLLDPFDLAGRRCQSFAPTSTRLNTTWVSRQQGPAGNLALTLPHAAEKGAGTAWQNGHGPGLFLSGMYQPTLVWGIVRPARVLGD